MLKNKKKKKKRRKFLTYFTVSLIIFFAMTALAYTISVKTELVDNKNNNINNSNNGNILDDVFGTKQVKTNVAIFGTDEKGLRTDVIFVVNFDSKTKKIGLLSIPRDTKVTMTDEMIKHMKENQKKGPHDYTCKINEVHAYAPKDERNEFSVMQLEDLLKIEIDYYAKIDLEAFRVIVDAFGGVDIDVPRDMKYDDPYQDLHINLKKGIQHLDGKKAEQLVRFRKYDTADIGRIEVQQLFMTELMKKILNTQNILSNIPTIIDTLFNYVETNVGIDDLLKYAKYINDIKAENVIMDMLPGEAKYIDEVSYFINDTIQTKITVDKLFYGIELIDESSITSDENEENKSSKNKNIEVLNGSYINGMAAKTKDKLENDGFTVVSTGTHNETKEEKTAIIVKQEGMGKDLEKYFPESYIEVNPDKLSSDIDIRIIIGIN